LTQLDGESSTQIEALSVQLQPQPEPEPTQELGEQDEHESQPGSLTDTQPESAQLGDASDYSPAQQAAL
jgi:hypothetical protein